MLWCVAVLGHLEINLPFNAREHVTLHDDRTILWYIVPTNDTNLGEKRGCRRPRHGTNAAMQNLEVSGHGC